jgi:hypothetical protein
MLAGCSRLSRHSTPALPRSIARLARAAPVAPRASAVAEAEAELAADVALSPTGLAHSAESRRLVLGVDPDVNGALATLRWEGSPGKERLAAAVHDTPTELVSVGSGAAARDRRRHDPGQMHGLLTSLALPAGTLALLERPHARHGVGTNSAFQSGCGLGLWWGLLQAHGCDVRLVLPARWKRALQLVGADCDKDDSRALAARLLPEESRLFARKRDHGRAEALLIAAYGAAGEDACVQAFTAAAAASAGGPPLAVEVRRRMADCLGALGELGGGGAAESARVLAEAAASARAATAAARAAQPKPPKRTAADRRAARAEAADAALEALSCEQLRQALAVAGLKRTGNKAALLARLRGANGA